MGAQDVKRAADAGDWHTALRLALETWRESPHPVVAEVVLELDRNLAFDGPRAQSRADFDLAWHQVAKTGDPAGVGWLARTVSDKLPMATERFAAFREGYLQRKYAAWFSRLAVLATFPPDPRIAAGMQAVLERSRLSVGWRAEVDVVYGPALALLERSMDAGTPVWAAALAERPQSSQTSVRDWLAVTLRALRSPDPEPLELPAVWESMRPRAERGLATANEILAAVRADPTDLGLRQVYADVLQELGDPLGTFIALQLRGDDDAEKKARTLFRKHGSEWLGTDLSRTLTGVELRDGFLDRASLAQNAVADQEGWDRSYVDERLFALTRLEKGRGNARHYTSFVTSPATGCIADVEIPASAVLDEILKCKHPKDFRMLRFPRLPKPPVLRRIAASRHFEGLVGIGLEGSRGRRPSDVVRAAVQDLRKSGLDRVRRLAISLVWGEAEEGSLFTLIEELELESLTVGRGGFSVSAAVGETGLRIEADVGGVSVFGRDIAAFEGAVESMSMVDDGTKQRWMPVAGEAVAILQSFHPGIEVRRIFRPELSLA
ncbi:MAG: TIGR02996 domain-containing protein [Myxococcota bacterium]